MRFSKGYLSGWLCRHPLIFGIFLRGGGRKHGLLLRVGGAVLVLLISFSWFKISNKFTTDMKKFSYKVTLYIILLQNNKSNPWLGYYHPPSRRILGSTESHVKWSRILYLSSLPHGTRGRFSGHLGGKISMSVVNSKTFFLVWEYFNVPKISSDSPNILM